MLPRDTNPHGTIFGGVLLSYIDQAGSVAAQTELRRRQWPERTMVTVAMNGVEFHEPVFVGDIVSFLTEVTRVGTTSITVHVSVETERRGKTVRLTEAETIFVAVDLTHPERRAVPLRPVND